MDGSYWNYNNYLNTSSTSWWDQWVNGVPTAMQGLLVGLLVMVCLVGIALVVLLIVGMARAFKKAKQPSWAAIIPYYNIFTVIKITGLELWWFVALTILGFMSGYAGLAFFAMWAFTNYKVAKSFGKDISFAIGLTLLPSIFWMMLGYGDAKYKGPAGPYKIKYPESSSK